MACGRGGNPSGSQANHLPLTGEARAVACGAVLFASPAKGRWGRRAAHGSVGSCFFQQLRFATPPVRNPSGSQPLRFASEPPPLDRGGNGSSPCRGGDPSVSRADSSPWQGSQGRSTWQGRQPPQSMRLFTAASIYSHTPRKFLFTSLFGMRRTVKP